MAAEIQNGRRPKFIFLKSSHIIEFGMLSDNIEVKEGEMNNKNPFLVTKSKMAAKNSKWPPKYFLSWRIFSKICHVWCAFRPKMGLWTRIKQWKNIFVNHIQDGGWKSKMAANNFVILRNFPKICRVWYAFRLNQGRWTQISLKKSLMSNRFFAIASILSKNTNF